MNAHKTIIQFLAQLEPKEDESIDWRGICLHMASKHPATFLELVDFQSPAEETAEERADRKKQAALNRASAVLGEHGPIAKIEAVKMYRTALGCGLKEAVDEINKIIDRLYPNQH
jgi:hypothetical protein